MKQTVFILLSAILILSGCSKEKPSKLEVFSSEAFAYQIGDSSEVDATTRVKGFKEEMKNGMYSATIGYDIDLVKPNGDTVKSIVSKVEDKSKKEKFSEIPIDIQFDLDSTYVKGKYKIVIRVKDALSNQSAVSSAGFTIGD